MLYKDAKGDVSKSVSNIRYFAEKNPGWKQGDELACLVRLTKDNFNRMGLRMAQGE